MKKVKFSMVMLALVVTSCWKPEAYEPVSESFTASVESFDFQTKTSMTSEKYVVWSQDDRLAIFQGNTLADEFKVSDANVGMANATFTKVTTASDDFSAGTEMPCNVALYPYGVGLTLTGSIIEDEDVVYKVSGVIIPQEQIYTAASFANGSFPMVAVTETISDHNLKFKNVLGALRLRLKGTQTLKSISVRGKNGERLSGAAVVTVSENNLTPAISMIATDDASRSVTLNCGDGVQLSESTVTDFIISLPPVVFSKGFTVDITDTDDKIQKITAYAENTVLRSTVLTMPSLTLEVSEDETPDSGLDIPVVPVTYVGLDVSAMDLYKGGSVQLTAAVSPHNATDKTLEWSTDDASVAVVDQNGLVTAVSGGIAVISVKAGGIKASCTIRITSLVATTDYIDEYNICHGRGVVIGNAVWAPVNCGYHEINYPYGKLYQWGRKYGQGYDSVWYDQYLVSSKDATAPVIEEGGVSPVWGNRIENENVFYLRMDSITNDWSDPSYDKLWNSGSEEIPKKTEYDPCPVGWRVPTYAELNELSQNSSSGLPTDANHHKGKFFSGPYVYLDDAPKVFIPVAGYRDNLRGIASLRTEYGFYWSSRGSDNNSDMLFIEEYGNVDVSNNTGYRSYGCSVRCVQE